LFCIKLDLEQVNQFLASQGAQEVMLVSD